VKLTVFFVKNFNILGHFIFRFVIFIVFSDLSSSPLNPLILDVLKHIEYIIVSDSHDRSGGRSRSFAFVLREIFL